MAQITYGLDSFAIYHDDFLKTNLWGEGRRKFLAILRCDCENGTEFLNYLAIVLDLADESAKISLTALNDFFAYDSLEILDNQMEFDGEFFGEDYEEPSDLVLKYYSHED